MIPLQRQLRIEVPQAKQIWLADDAAGAGTLGNLLNWWNSIIDKGTHLGYHVNEGKSWLILKNLLQRQEA